MSYRTEFPGYPAAEMPLIPHVWRDASQRGDVSPSFIVWERGMSPDDAETLRVYIERAHPADRECDGPRFTLAREYADGHGPDVLMLSESWVDILRAVAGLDTPSKGPDDALTGTRVDIRYQGWNILHSADRGDGETGWHVYAKGFAVFAPFVSSCGRFDVDPVTEWGIPHDVARALRMLNPDADQGPIGCPMPPATDDDDESAAMLSVPMSALRAFCNEHIGNDSLCDEAPSAALASCFDYADAARAEGDEGPARALAVILRGAILSD